MIHAMRPNLSLPVVGRDHQLVRGKQSRATTFTIKLLMNHRTFPKLAASIKFPDG